MGDTDEDKGSGERVGNSVAGGCSGASQRRRPRSRNLEKPRQSWPICGKGVKAEALRRRVLVDAPLLEPRTQEGLHGSPERAAG